MTMQRNGQFARVNQRDIHYIDEGSGQPLVLLHGWGFDHTCWRPVIDRLTPRYRVIAVDLRGHGRSQASSSAYQLSDLSSDLFGLIGELNLPEAPVLIGHSLGGAVVQQFVVDYPDSARSIVLLDSDLNGPAALRWFMIAANRASSWVMRLAGLLLGAKRSLRLYSPLLSRVIYTRGWRRANAEIMRDESKRFVEANNVDDLVWSLLAWASRPNLAERLATVSTPALLVRGSRDLIVPQGKIEALSRAIPGSRLLVVRRCGHATISERPDKVSGMIDFFVQAPPSRAEDEAPAEQRVAGGHEPTQSDRLRVSSATEAAI